MGHHLVSHDEVDERLSRMRDALVFDTLDVDGHSQLLKVLEERLVVDQEDLTARIKDDLAGDLDGGSSSDEAGRTPLRRQRG